jgi:hypothetical protein
MGESGTGKSTSIRNFDPASTFIISVLDKPLPFRGYKKKYIPIKDGKGNYFCSTNWMHIVKCIHMINEKMPHIKTIIIDDLQYIMSIEYMNRAQEKGYNKYTEMAGHIWAIFNALLGCRSDLYCFVLTHTEVDAQGISRIKTIGKMLSEKITLEGVVTCVLHSTIIDGEYKFLTQNNGFSIAKSPMDLFNDEYIDNDLNFVQKEMIKYYNGE